MNTTIVNNLYILRERQFLHDNTSKNSKQGSLGKAFWLYKLPLPLLNPKLKVFTACGWSWSLDVLAKA